MTVTRPPSLCKTVGSLAGRCPAPRPSHGDGGSEGVISSPGQAEPYYGTSGAAKAHFDRPPGQTLAAPENRVAPRVPGRRDDLTPRQPCARICARDPLDRAERPRHMSHRRDASKAVQTAQARQHAKDQARHHRPASCGSQPSCGRYCGETAPACGADWRLAARRMGILRASTTGQHRPAGSE
jgi:hypothetical protein